MIEINTNKKLGFSLAEVMIALVIVAILMAASAPLINRRANVDSGFNCFWENSTNGIYYKRDGTGKVGIGVEPTSANGLHIKSSTEAAQINFYDKDSTDVSNVLGLYNNNIILGSADNVNSTTGNVVIGYADLLGTGNKLVVGARNSTTPMLYGEFNNTLASQRLKVNGQLQVGTNSTSIIDNSAYSLLVDEAGMYSYGPIVSTNRFYVKHSDTNLFEVHSDGIFVGKSMRTYSSIYAEGEIIADMAIKSKANIYAEGEISAEASIWTENFMYVGGNSANAPIVMGNKSISAQGDIYAGGDIISDKAIRSKANIYAEGDIYVDNYIEASKIGDQLKSVITTLISNPTSDEKLKKEIKASYLGLETIRKIEVKEYKFKDQKKYGEGVRYGVIAQDIQKILPNVVKTNNDGFLTIRPNDIFFVAINAIKELDKELQNIKYLLNIDELKIDCSKLSAFKIVAKLNRLQAENIELKNEIKILKEQNNILEKRLEKIEQQLKLDEQ